MVKRLRNKATNTLGRNNGNISRLSLLRAHRARLSLTGLFVFSLIGTLISTAAYAEPPIAAFQQQFRLSSSGIPFSIKADRRLEYRGDGIWAMTISADNWLGEVEETTIFSWQQCTPLSNYYGYKRQGMGKERHAQMFFNHQTGHARVLRAAQESHYPINTNTTDKLSHTLALQCLLSQGSDDLSMDIADERGLDRIEYRHVGEEVLNTPAGKFATVKIERIREPGSSRQTSMWFAKNYGYALVQMVQDEDNKQHTMTLKKFSH
jgi:uncharacterized protein DUF3108